MYEYQMDEIKRDLESIIDDLKQFQSREIDQAIINIEQGLLWVDRHFEKHNTEY